MQIAVIAKEPIPGRVKTRLCPPFTPTDAAALAAAALDDTLRTVAATPAVRRVLVLDGAAGPWVPAGFDVIPQRGAGLAARLSAAFEDGMRTCREPMVLVGMDTPQLTSAALVRAGARLHAGRELDRRAVLGPAIDGGYWLIGLSLPDGAVFDGVGMSETTTASQQLRRLRRRRFTVAPCEHLRDVDTYADAAIVARLAPGGAFARTFRDRVAARSLTPS